MATVLLAQEFGAGLGDVMRLVAVARDLEVRGHRPVFAVRNLVESAIVLGRYPAPVFQAPLWIGAPVHLLTSYADRLERRGFGVVDDLEPRVRAWQTLLNHLDPRLIIADNAPSLCVAALGTIPSVVVGNGFTVPPTGGRVLAPCGAPDEEETEARVLAVVAEVQRRRGRPEPASLAGLFPRDASFACVLPEFDPFNTVRREPAIGPLEPLLPPQPAPPPHLFAYLARKHPHFENIVLALAELGARVSVFARGAPESLKRFLRSRGSIVHDEPPLLGEVMARASVALHHGGLGVAQAAMSAGRPQVVIPFPRYVEQRFNRDVLALLGVGTEASADAAPELVARTLTRVLEDPVMAERAALVARGLAERPFQPALTRVVDTCLDLLDRVAA